MIVKIAFHFFAYAALSAHSLDFRFFQHLMFCKQGFEKPYGGEEWTTKAWRGALRLDGVNPCRHPSYPVKRGMGDDWVMHPFT